MEGGHSTSRWGKKILQSIPSRQMETVNRS